MVDPESVEHPGGDELEHQGVALVEHLGLLDAQADQGLDVEEPPVVEVLAGRPPVGQAVVLAPQEHVEAVGVGAQLAQDGVERGGSHDVPLAQDGEVRAQRRPRPVTLADRGRVSGDGGGQGGRPVGQFAEGRRPGSPGGLGQDAVDAVEGHRQLVVAVADPEPTADPDHGEIPGFEDPAVVVGQHRDEHVVGRTVVGALPVDVEEPCVRAGRTVLEDVPPPRVVLVGGHVVRHDVEHLAQPGPT